MAENNNTAHSWVLLIRSLVWPITIFIILIAYHSHVSAILSAVGRAAGEEGREIRLAGWLEIGARAEATEVQSFRMNDVVMESVSGRDHMAVKGSAEALESIRERLRTSPSGNIEVLTVSDRMEYASGVMRDYVSTLGVRFMVFESSGKFEGWAHATVIAAQLEPEDRYSYQNLKKLPGFRSTSVHSEDSAKFVLEKMQKEGFDEVAVVDSDSHFQFMVSRTEILSRLLAPLIVSSSGESNSG